MGLQRGQRETGRALGRAERSCLAVAFLVLPTDLITLPSTTRVISIASVPASRSSKSWRARQAPANWRPLWVASAVCQAPL
jgi:hypothetical protein